MDFHTSAYGAELDPGDWLIPTRTGTAVVAGYTDPQTGCLVLLNIDAECYAKQEPHTIMLALSEEMICGLITQLSQAMDDAGIPQHTQWDMLKSAAMSMHTRKRAN